MGLDTDLTGILRDFVQFLEASREVKLPPNLETMRENLLSRSKSALLNLAIGLPPSPEPYLDMNAGKGLLLTAKCHNDIQEYINTDQNSEPKINQDYYETFQEINNVKTNTSLSIEDEKKESVENTLASIYSSFSAAQTKLNCNKCGQLSRKIEKKIFPFIDPLRICWVGLLGTHLLIFGSEKDCRPNTVIPIRGYRGRPAPNIDSKRSESAFEIFCPGHKTLQFVAKTPEEMEEWVEMICETSNRESNNRTRIRESSFTETLEIEQKDTKNSEFSLEDERYQDADFRPSKSKENLLNLRPSSISELDKESNSEILLRGKLTRTGLDENGTPPLPARIPRRLPSLPHEEEIPSFEPVDEHYDEDDIYHKIEDFRDGTGYQNCMVVKKEDEEKKRELKKHCYSETYDDIVGEIHAQQFEKDFKSEKVQEAYDNVPPVTQEAFLKKTEMKNNQSVVDAAVPYDDVQTIAIELTTKSVHEPKEEKLSGSARIKASKKSFLDRMRNRSYVLKKGDKNRKRGSSPVSSNSIETLPNYDDISGINNSPQQEKLEIEEQSEYLCPPAPRPIYSTPPTATSCSVEELYDDIAACSDKMTRGNESSESEISINSTFSNQKATEIEISSMKLNTNPERCFQSDLNKTNEQSQMEFEYYQTPRSDRVLQVEEVLYDDVALLTKFRAKSRESSVSNFEKVWSRFSSGRTKNPINETEENTDFSQTSNDQQEVRVNRFQKLVNKIENTLGKTSIKPLPLTNSKSNTSSSTKIDS